MNNMKRTVNTKIVWLFVLLVTILFASTTFGTFEPFVGTAPGIGQTGVGAGAIAQKAKANYNASGSVLPTTMPSMPSMPSTMTSAMSSSMPTTTTEGFWAPRARAAVNRGYY